LDQRGVEPHRLSDERQLLAGCRTGVRVDDVEDRAVGRGGKRLAGPGDLPANLGAGIALGGAPNDLRDLPCDVGGALVGNAGGVTTAGRRFSARPNPYVPPEEPEGKINVTDPDSRNLKVSNGYVQGYNAQAVVGEGQIVIAAEVTIGPQDFGHLGPMVTAARRELADAGANEKPDVVLADSGYWHGVQMDTLTGDGIQVLIPPDSPSVTGHDLDGPVVATSGCATSWPANSVPSSIEDVRS